jgi:hypothetical protein
LGGMVAHGALAGARQTRRHAGTEREKGMGCAQKNAGEGLNGAVSGRPPRRSRRPRPASSTQRCTRRHTLRPKHSACAHAEHALTCAHPRSDAASAAHRVRVPRVIIVTHILSGAAPRGCIRSGCRRQRAEPPRFRRPSPLLPRSNLSPPLLFNPPPAGRPLRPARTAHPTGARW